MQNKNSKIVVWVLVIIIAVGAWYFLANKKSVTNEPVVSLEILGNKDDLVSISIVPGATIHEGDIITGSLKNNYFFEANARGDLLNANKDHMTGFPITATSDWMTTEPVNFSFTVSYSVDDTPITKGPGYLEISNDNPSGDPANDKHILIPVVIQ